jgi:hypothetical protein
LEDFILKQEEKINELSNKFKIIDETLRKKKEEARKSENNCNSLIKIIEDQKKTINNFMSSSNLLQSEEQIKKRYQEKETEVNYLKNILSSLKTENSLKNESLSNLKKIMGKVKEENRLLKMIVKSIELSQEQKDKINSINSEGVNMFSKLLSLISKDDSGGDGNTQQNNALKMSNKDLKVKEEEISPVQTKKKTVGKGSNHNSFSLYVDDNNKATDESMREITQIINKMIAEN